MVECKNCEQENAERSIFITRKGDEKGLSPEDVEFEAEENTSYTICEECYRTERYMK